MREVHDMIVIPSNDYSGLFTMKLGKYVKWRKRFLGMRCTVLSILFMPVII